MLRFKVEISFFWGAFYCFCFIYVQFQFLAKPLIILELLKDLWYTVGKLIKQSEEYSLFKAFNCALITV